MTDPHPNPPPWFERPDSYYRSPYGKDGRLDRSELVVRWIVFTVAIVSLVVAVVVSSR